jgi:predicted transcriptional regulator
MAATIEEIADAMYELVKEYTGRKSFTARELSKEMAQKFGSDKSTVKEALRHLLDSGRCVYTYKGTSYIELAGRDKQ